MRQSLGIAVFAGMIGVTLFGVFLTPVFFFVLLWLRERRPARPATVPRLAVARPATGDGATSSEAIRRHGGS